MHALCMFFLYVSLGISVLIIYFLIFNLNTEVDFAADVRPYQKWYCTQSWGSGSDMTLSQFRELPGSILLADVSEGDEPLNLLFERLFSQFMKFRNFSSDFL